MPADTPAPDAAAESPSRSRTVAAGTRAPRATAAVPEPAGAAAARKKTSGTKTAARGGRAKPAITRAMADQARTIRIPVHMVEVINKLGRIQRELLQDLGREPTPEELAKEMDITPDKVLEIQQYAREPISLDQTIGDEGDSQLGDFIEDSEAVVAVDAVSFTLLQDQLQSVLQTLSEREAGVVKLRFGLTDGQPRTLDEIGQVYGVTRERIRQIESKTMSKLRHPSRSQVLRDYLD